VVVTMGAPPISLMGDELLGAFASAAAPEYVGRHAREEPEAGSP
jgi:hypothetical protein